MTLVADLVAPWLATALFWLTFGACVDQPAQGPPPIARVVAIWDPLACGPPHRVALELEDDSGAMVSASGPCNAGGLALDTPHTGRYRGRIYAPDESEENIEPVELVLEQPIYRWWLGSPP
jgi:hypothetical protein